jgi:hypothetical protein
MVATLSKSNLLNFFHETVMFRVYLGVNNVGMLLMTNLYPQKTVVKNFQPDDIEGKHLFKESAATLNGLFADPERSDFITFVASIGNPSGSEHDVQTGMRKSLIEIAQLHDSMTKLVGYSAQRGEDVPVMSYFVDAVEQRGHHADAHAKMLAEQMKDGRPFDAEAMAKEGFRNVLLEVATLNHFLSQPDGAEAFQELMKDKKQQRASLTYSLPFAMTAKDDLNDQQQFSSFKHAVASAYEKMQQTLGVKIPDEKVVELIEHPLTSTLSTSSLDDIRSQHFHLNDAYTPIVQKLILPSSVGKNV